MRTTIALFALGGTLLLAPVIQSFAREWSAYSDTQSQAEKYFEIVQKENVKLRLQHDVDIMAMIRYKQAIEDQRRLCGTWKEAVSD